MNWRKDIYTKLIEVLTPLKTNGTIKYIDLDKGQFDQPAKSYPIVRPAVLIGIQSSGELEHMTNNWMESEEATITLLVILDNRHLSFVGSESINDSIAILDLIETIVITAVFTSGETFTDFHFKNEEKLTNQFDGLQRHLITFTTQLHFQIKETATINITG